MLSKGDVLSVCLHNVWVTTELLCQCRLRSYKATEEIRKDATSTTKKRLWNESRSKRVKRYSYQSLVSIIWDNARVVKHDVKRNIL
jgi:hypothetical protein